ncbi:MAG: tetratricopeptide repeat protein [Candidatus Nitrosotenuis sp.]|uniref:Tetratricopeptide TPR_2 repeat protein n=1 Tax=Candidatus Nitrosotenuis uzonensis TaxID=1407055 RepID=A0A812F058_9ARCH|nr:tetratricopeptide repeat protein [Candidatus Nitrosotenuis uzonensis]MCA2003730.1 tetratricopeptide repeat protein [Candidatus Nitrosotenuis sp.]CAE6488660.1 Tetratricopeptide TPR_2 repeat protein [Candidatus Nitrosotenuis uzonensis]
MSEHELLLPAVTEENICLPLAVSAVSQYWNVNLPIAEAKEIAKKYPNMHGSILIEGIELAERHGLGSLILHSTLSELKKVIDMGVPPIVILPGLFETVQHASVISGYDEKEKSIIHYMPQPDQIGVIPEKQFDKLWEEDGRLMILLAPSDIISKIKTENKSKEKSNRLCFVSEKLNLQNRKEEAIKTLREAITIDGSNSTALCLLGGIYNEKNMQECVQYYEQSIKHNNSCYLAYRGLGNYYLKTKQYDKADSYYTKAIKINPTRFGPIYKNRGIAKLELNKKKEAKEDFESYLKHMPNAKDKESIMQAIKEL